MSLHLLKKQPNYFFSVSTDKATNPVNIMGASKSLMEKIIISVKDKIRVSTARFANVAFSNGSLLHGFEYRLLKKGYNIKNYRYNLLNKIAVILKLAFHYGLNPQFSILNTSKKQIT